MLTIGDGKNEDTVSGAEVAKGKVLVISIRTSHHIEFSSSVISGHIVNFNNS